MSTQAEYPESVPPKYVISVWKKQLFQYSNIKLEFAKLLQKNLELWQTADKATCSKWARTYHQQQISENLYSRVLQEYIFHLTAAQALAVDVRKSK